MSSTADDGTDEVKVFRRSDADDVETAQSTHQLTEDKKEVALEDDYEATSIVPRSGAFVKPSPTYQSLAGLSPNFTPVPFLPFLVPSRSPYGVCFPPPPVASLSPNYTMFCVPQPSLSPSFLLPHHASPLTGSPAVTPKGCNPFPDFMRNMTASAPHPLNSINQMRLPQMGSPITSMANDLAHTVNGNAAAVQKRIKSEAAAFRKIEHVKKPLNAFMWFMKKNRPKLMEEMDYKERQSAELNKELGRRWHDLPKEEQQKYFDLAKEDRQRHMQKYPNWSARENYALNRKKKKKNRDKADENGEQKKCRARFGLARQDQWCKHCKRKKRCLWYREGRETASPMAAVVSSTTPGTPGTPTSLSGPGAGAMSSRDSDSGSEVEGEDPSVARAILEQVGVDQKPVLMC